MLIALLFVLLVLGGSVYGLAQFIRWFQHISKLPLEKRSHRPTASPSPRPVDELDREVFARVRTTAQEQTATRLHLSSPITRTDVPDHLPVKVKSYFFSRSEQAFFQVLEEALPPGYRVFPNVRLNDLFLITAAPHQRQGTYARLRDKHVDFLVVSLPDHRPVFTIELDGASHDNAAQQHRDAVKDTAFRSAGLPLLRLRAEEQHTRQSLEAALKRHVWAVQTARQTVA